MDIHAPYTGVITPDKDIINVYVCVCVCEFICMYMYIYTCIYICKYTCFEYCHYAWQRYHIYVYTPITDHLFMRACAYV